MNAEKVLTAEEQIEQIFLASSKDAFAIYRLREDAPRELRYAGMDWLTSPPARDHYDAIYTGTLTAKGSNEEKLEKLYRVFNEKRPEDFKGHSVSVSDIIALKQGGMVSYHYCDRFGFRELNNLTVEKPSVLAKLKSPARKPQTTKPPTKHKETTR